MGGAGRFSQNHPSPPKKKIHLTCQLRNVEEEQVRKYWYSLRMSTACLFKKIDAQYCYKSHLSVLNQEFSLFLWLHVRPENEPPQNWSVPILLALSDGPKKSWL